MSDEHSLTNEVGRAAALAWEQILGLKLEPSLATRAPENGEVRWTALVGLAGPRSVALTVVCSDLMARRATGVMFDMEPAAANSGEISDALGELVNIVGGQTKMLLGETCKVGFPTVVEGCDYQVTVPDARPIVRLFFQCEGEPVEVTLLHAKPFDFTLTASGEATVSPREDVCES